MSIRRRVARLLAGTRSLERTIDRMLVEIDVRARRGLPEVTVSIAQTDIGAYRRLATVTPIVVERLTREGHSVLSADAPNGDWTGVVTFRVRPRPHDGA